jgi:ubiquinone/menaquinone biosynthesis C-methylase UbiE
VNTDSHAQGTQKAFDFSSPRPRPFLSGLPARIDGYEEGVARFFEWRTGLSYYATVDQIVDFVINTRRLRVADLLTDTGAFALRLSGRKAFHGKVFSFDSNITLLERARQRAKHLSLAHLVEFREFDGSRWPLPPAASEIAVSIFDFHRHSAPLFLEEARRILVPDGHLLIAELLVPENARHSLATLWRRLHIRYVHKNAAEAQGNFYDREVMIRMLFEAGFRQVVVQELRKPSSPGQGIFSLVAATK